MYFNTPFEFIGRSQHTRQFRFTFIHVLLGLVFYRENENQFLHSRPRGSYHRLGNSPECHQTVGEGEAGSGVCGASWTMGATEMCEWNQRRIKGQVVVWWWFWIHKWSWLEFFKLNLLEIWTFYTNRMFHKDFFEIFWFFGNFPMEMFNGKNCPWGAALSSE